MSEIFGLLLTLAIGLFIILGSVIVFITKNNDNFVNFSISIAFGVIVSLIILELIPESLELMNENSSAFLSAILVFSFALLGLIVSKILDYFIPDHEVIDEKEKQINKNLFHIGLISSIVLILHNVIEGMAVYSSLITSFSLGLLVSIGVGLHNIPMGMVITSTIYKANQNIKRTIMFITIISLSTFLGGLIMYFNNSFLISSFILGSLLSITLGMLLYIVMFELLPHMVQCRNKKKVFIGVILGIFLMVISLWIE